MFRDKVKLHQRGVFARNVMWNLIGNGAPLLVAIIAIPVLINSLGTDRFGVLTLAWMVVGYFSLFDLGLGRALTQLVSERLGSGKEEDVVPLVWTTLALMALFSIAGSCVLVFVTPWFVGDILNIPANLYQEALVSFYMLVVSVPIVVSTAALRGFLEAHQRFDLVNIIRIPLGIYTFLGPLLVLPFSNNLIYVVLVLVLGRLVAWIAHFKFCYKVDPALRLSISFRKELVKPLISFGGWMTVSNVVGPLMVYMDRFLIGAMVSMSAVAYYATPFEVVSKLRMIPNALVGVLFPAFSANHRSDPEQTKKLLNTGIIFVLITLFPIVLIIVTFAYEGMSVWLGKEFAENSYRVLQLLAVGMFINGFAVVAFALVQGVGRPDITAKLHLIELPVYLALLWFLIDRFGIDGVALAWVIRVFLDKFLLFWIANKYMPIEMGMLVRLSIMFILALVALIIGGFIDSSLTHKFIYSFIILFIMFPGLLFLFFFPKERLPIRSLNDLLKGIKLMYK